MAPKKRQSPFQVEGWLNMVKTPFMDAIATDVRKGAKGGRSKPKGKRNY
jgi:hypothetical protein